MVNKRVLHRGITYVLKWEECAGMRPANTPIKERKLGRSPIRLQGPYDVPVENDKVHLVYRLKAYGQTIGYMDEDTLYLRAEHGYYTNRLIKGLSYIYNIVKLGGTTVAI